MPAVRVELQKGRDRSTLVKLRDLLLDSMVDALQVPTDDRNIRIMEYDADLFQLTPPYEILVEITLFAGRTKDTKRKLYRAIVERLESKAGIAGEKVMIILNEVPLQNWGLRGGIPADEVDLGFKVNI